MEYRENLRLDEPEHRLIRAEIAEGDIVLTGMSQISIPTRFGEKWIPSVLVGGVGTKPEYRRGGHVRELFERMFAASEREPWVVSLLHPFSFNYYRMFGYELVSDHRLVTVAMDKLSHIPRFSEFRPLKESELPEVLDLYNNRFAPHRNLTQKRFDTQRFPFGDNSGDVAYALRENGRFTAYLRLHTEKKYIVNHMGEGVLTVKEIVFESLDALVKAMGFLRMYEGELEQVFFANLAPIPEVEYLLREYIAEKIEIVPDVAARVLDTVGLLEAVSYPQKAGQFIIKIEDILPKVAGTYHVEYADGKAEITKLCEDAAWDICTDAAGFARLAYGYDGANARMARYMPGVRLNNDAEDFFRAFPKQICGIFEHF